MIDYKSLLSICIIFGIEINRHSCSDFNKYSNTCDSPVCHETAAKLKKNMDFSVDPCTDFYKFVCGKFQQNISALDNKKSYSQFDIIQDLVDKQLNSSFNEKIIKCDTKSDKLMKTFYQNCMDTEFIQSQKFKPLREILDKLGGWPVLGLNSTNDVNFDWMKFEYKSRELGITTNAFISYFLTIDNDNSFNNVISIDSAVLELNSGDLYEGLENINIKAYHKYMVDVAMMLNTSLDKKQVDQEFEDVIKFYIELDRIFFDLNNVFDSSDTNIIHEWKIIDLKSLYDVPWLEFINQMLEPIQKVDENEVIYVNEPNYFRKLDKLIQVTPKRVQANYALWRVIHSSNSYLNDEMLDKNLEYLSITQDPIEREPRWKKCMNLMLREFSVGVSALYVRNYFDDESKKNVIELSQNIANQFVNTIQGVTWMDNQTMVEALNKLEVMSALIGYPNELMDGRVEQFYDSLEINRGNFWESVRNITLHNNNYKVKKFFSRIRSFDLLEYGSKATWITAEYSPYKNHLKLSAALLQDIFYKKENPYYMNYGAIGYVIGHEIVHGFDNLGSTFDKFGNLVNWWTNESRANFDKKIQCITEQYSQFEVKINNTYTLKVDGTKTLGENIADNGGTRQAYLAYKLVLQESGGESSLPEFENFTPLQMFWISLANSKCTSHTQESLVDVLMDDSHPPEEFRTNGLMQNQPEFAKDFKCKNYTFMNPKKKCRVW